MKLSTSFLIAIALCTYSDVTASRSNILRLTEITMKHPGKTLALIPCIFSAYYNRNTLPKDTKNFFDNIEKAKRFSEKCDVVRNATTKIVSAVIIEAFNILKYMTEKQETASENKK